MTKEEHLRLVTSRSKLLEYAKRIGNVSAACRHFGISRERFYKWKKRFDEIGDAGLADQPRRPGQAPALGDRYLGPIAIGDRRVEWRHKHMATGEPIALGGRRVAWRRARL